METEDLWTFLDANRSTVSSTIADALKCTICRNILIKPRQTPCGCRFCETCINNHLSQQNHCPGILPQCQTTDISLSDITPDRALCRDIGKIKSKCSSPGCNYEENLENLARHWLVCPCRLRKCPYASVGCNSDAMDKSDIQNHLRDEECQHVAKLLDTLDNIRNNSANIEARRLNDQHQVPHSFDFKMIFVPVIVSLLALFAFSIFLKPYENERLQNAIKSMKAELKADIEVTIESKMKKFLEEWNELKSDVESLKNSRTDVFSKSSNISKEELIEMMETLIESRLDDLKLTSKNEKISSNESCIMSGKNMFINNEEFFWHISDFHTILDDLEKSRQRCYDSDHFLFLKTGLKGKLILSLLNEGSKHFISICFNVERIPQFQPTESEFDVILRMVNVTDNVEYSFVRFVPTNESVAKSAMFCDLKFVEHDGRFGIGHVEIRGQFVDIPKSSRWWYVLYLLALVGVAALILFILVIMDEMKKKR